MDLDDGHAPAILDECKKQGLLRNQAAYVLATVWHETGRYRYMREVWGPTPAQARYEKNARLGNNQAGDGKKFMGRGFIQVTGRANYQKWSQILGIDLLKEPQLAEEPDIAKQILVKGMKLGTFTGKKLSDYITLQASDFVGARRIVNGTDRAELIAGYARQYDAMLKAASYDNDPVPNAAVITVEPVSTIKPAHVGIGAAAVVALTGIAAGWHHITSFISGLFS